MFYYSDVSHIYAAIALLHYFHRSHTVESFPPCALAFFEYFYFNQNLFNFHLFSLIFIKTDKSRLIVNIVMCSSVKLTLFNTF